MKELEISFASGGLVLEGVLGLPEGEGPFPGVVVCHPHPLYGGTMDYIVITSICAALTRASLVSLRFNFRGVGRSQGVHDNGRGEAGDVTAALDYLCARSEVNTGKIGLAGNSAGAAYSLRACLDDDRVKAVGFVSPPLSMFDFSPLKGCLKPKFLICGDRDGYSPAAQYQRFCRELPEPKECRTVAGADHFWVGYEGPLAAETAGFFARRLA